jgi:glutamine amidotransferase
MCLLTFLRAHVMPDTTALLAGAALNHDGYGFAVVAGDQLIVRRGLDGPQMVDAFATLRRQHPHGPALFHSRFATDGDRGIDNCHPFPVGADPRTVIAHNGVLPAAVRPGTKDRRSDTRITAEDFLPRFGPLRLRRVRRRFERWMTPNNLMVLLTVDRRFKQRAYILNEPSGIWDGGIWYSNDGYLPAPPTRWHLTGEPRWGWPAWDRTDLTTGRCGFCHALIDPTLADCPCCGWCLDCGQMPEDCGCYTPAALDRRYGSRSPSRPV